MTTRMQILLLAAALTAGGPLAAQEVPSTELYGLLDIGGSRSYIALPRTASRRTLSEEHFPDRSSYEYQLDVAKQLRLAPRDYDSFMLRQWTDPDGNRRSEVVWAVDEAAQIYVGEGDPIDWSRLSTRPGPSGLPGDARVGGP